MQKYSQARRIMSFTSCIWLTLLTLAVPDEPNHWSFQPIARPTPPVVANPDVARNAIDSFVLRKLKVNNISPSREADDLTLLRRASLDLIGLPPTPSEVDAFLADKKPGRYERAVDRLLVSPHYGERWAVPWLDLCHYADTDGYLTDQLRPVAWRYRSWLINALNQNQSFDQFTIEQLAADLLKDVSIDQRLATGFLRQTLSNREGGADPEEFRVKQIIDRTEMVGTVWLGLTVGCARCHDHKYDPIAQKEFFQLYACLDNADEANIDAPLPDEKQAYLASRDEYNRRRREIIDPQRAEVEALQKRWEEKCLHARANPGQDHIWDRQWELVGLVWGGGLGEGQLEGQEIMRLPWKQRSPRRSDDLMDYFLRVGSIVDSARYNELKLSELRSRLLKLKSELPSATRAPVMQASLTKRQTYVHERGEFRDRGEDVAPSTLECLPTWKPLKGEDARLVMARWLVSKQNPLTARVIINRMWEQFFGRGLVQTTEDFGLRGEAPAHPELFDWLASRLMDSGWDVKAMHRLIVTSATYRRSSTYRDDLKSVDPNNVLLARQNALRISAEMVRDSGLAVSGLLETKLGGPSVKPQQSERVTMEGFGNHTWKVSDAPDCYRRGLYTFRIRTTPFAQGVIFDAPNPNEICTRRARSNTPLQALTLLNDPAFYEMAQAMGRRVLEHDGLSDSQRIELAVQTALARQAMPDERAYLLNYLKSQRSNAKSDADAWTNVCSVLLNLHEFITRH